MFSIFVLLKSSFWVGKKPSSIPSSPARIASAGHDALFQGSLGGVQGVVQAILSRPVFGCPKRGRKTRQNSAKTRQNSGDLPILSHLMEVNHRFPLFVSLKKRSICKCRFKQV